MRVISQNGMIDVPYELTAIHVSKNTIRMNMAGETGNGSILAVYSAETKTVKAIEMLREAYVGKIILQNIDISDEAFEMIKNWKTQVLSVASNCQEQEFDYINNTVFQFPKDEEIEVEDET